MPIRQRMRRRIYWPYCHYCGGHHYGPYGPPSPWMMERPTPEEEVENLKEHIEMLKEELKAAEEDLRELGKTK